MPVGSSPGRLDRPSKVAAINELLAQMTRFDADARPTVTELQAAIADLRKQLARTA